MSNDSKTPIDYRVTKTREIAGQYRKEGDPVSLLPAQAKYYMAPYGVGLTLAADWNPEKQTKAPAKPAKSAS